MIIRRPEPRDTEMREKPVFASLAMDGSVPGGPGGPAPKRTEFTQAELDAIFSGARELGTHGKCKIVSVAGTLRKGDCDVSIFMDENGDFWYNKYQMV